LSTSNWIKISKSLNITTVSTLSREEEAKVAAEAKAAAEEEKTAE
jgi:hypothetical protein